MITDEILLTIIMPTKNNELVSQNTIRTITQMNLPNTELIVHNNGDTNELFNYIRDLINPNLHYVYFEQRLSIVDNFENSIKYISGKYVLYIGDDDLVHPRIIEYIKFAISNDIDCIVPKLNAVFYWDENNTLDYLWLKKFKNNIELVNPIVELKKLLHDGGFNYLKYKLPKIYHGIVKSSLVFEIIKSDKSFFGGLVPDIYSVINLSLRTKKVAYVDFPFTIPGISNLSESGKTKSIDYDHDLNLFKGHPKISNYGWFNEVPYFYTSETLWLESLCKALINNNRFDLIDKIDFNIIKDELYIRYGIKSPLNETSHKLKLNFKRFIFNSSFKIKLTIKENIYFKRLFYLLKGIGIYANVDNLSEIISIIDLNTNSITSE